MITFPTSPTDGQVHERWTWSAADNAWQVTSATAGGAGGVTTFADLTDKTTADLPTINTPTPDPE